jgi:ADP-ribosylglycohydrolase
MACSISGAYLGIDAIPPDWRTKLENQPEIEALAIQLAETRPRIGPSEL